METMQEESDGLKRSLEECKRQINQNEQVLREKGLWGVRVFFFGGGGKGGRRRV